MALFMNEIGGAVVGLLTTGIHRTVFPVQLVYMYIRTAAYAKENKKKGQSDNRNQKLNGLSTNVSASNGHNPIPINLVVFDVIEH